MTEEIRDKIERWKLLCEEEKKVFIKFIDNLNVERWCSAHVLIVGEKNLYFKPFKGNFIDKKLQVKWFNIIELNEYQERDK